MKIGWIRKFWYWGYYNNHFDHWEFCLGKIYIIKN